MLGARRARLSDPAAPPPPRAFPRIFTESSGRGLFIIIDDHFYYVFITADFIIMIPLTLASPRRLLTLASHIHLAHDILSFITSVFLRFKYAVSGAFHSLLPRCVSSALSMMISLFHECVAFLLLAILYRTNLNIFPSFRELAHSSLVGYGSSRALLELCHD